MSDCAQARLPSRSVHTDITQHLEERYIGGYVIAKLQYIEEQETGSSAGLQDLFTAN